MPQMSHWLPRGINDTPLFALPTFAPFRMLKESSGGEEAAMVMLDELEG